MKTALTLALAVTWLCLCQCGSRLRDPDGVNSTQGGRRYFEGARMGWHAPAADDDS